MLEAVIKGDTVREVLGYVQFDGEVLTARIIRDSGSGRPRRAP